MSTPRAPLSPARAIGLVAGREIRTRLRTKAFLIANAVIVVLIVGGLVLAAALTGGPTEADKVGLVGDTRSLAAALSSTGEAAGTAIETRELADAEAARAAVSAGDLDVALLPGTDGAVTAVTKGGLDPQLGTALGSVVRQAAVDAALAQQGVDPALLARAGGAATLTEQTLDPPRTVDAQRLALAYVAVLLLYAQLLQSGIAVASGVVEEKTSRVVEVLLSTLRPVQLLAGKVLGIGAVGLVQLGVYGVAGIGAATATGLLTVTGAAVGVFLATLGWFILGYAFFAVAYAATGSMVSRQEEIGATTTPLTILVIAMFALAQAAVADPTGTVSSVVSWIPPFSAILMPLRIAAGVTGWVQVVLTVALMLAVTAALTVLAARIYARSVLRQGKRVSWRQALGRA